MTEAQRSPAEEFRLMGAESGRDLGAAFLLASHRAGEDTGMKRQMAQVVLREIKRSVERLRDASVPALLVEAYERACRDACQGVLAVAIAAQSEPQRKAA